MCLNEKLSFNIRVKSRNCELFVLKKNDFLRLSVNFKEFIEKFLQRSLMIYLRFNDEKKKIMKTFDESSNKSNLNANSLNKNYQTSKSGIKGPNNESLEMIDEKEEEGASEEYDIFGDHSSSNKSDEDSSPSSSNSNSNNSANGKNRNSLFQNQISQNYNILNKISSSEQQNKNNMNNNNNISNANLLKNFNANLKKDNFMMSNTNEDFYNNGESNNLSNSIDILNKNSRQSKLLNNNLIGNSNKEFNLSFLNNNNNNINKEDQNYNNNNLSDDKIDKQQGNGEMNDHVEKLKSQMNKKFVKKVDKIIEFLEKNKIEIENNSSNNNTLNLLKRLKNVNDLMERNEIIDKIENTVTDIFNKAKKR